MYQARVLLKEAGIEHARLALASAAAPSGINTRVYRHPNGGLIAEAYYTRLPDAEALVDRLDGVLHSIKFYNNTTTHEADLAAIAALIDELELDNNLAVGELREKIAAVLS